LDREELLKRKAELEKKGAEVSLIIQQAITNQNQIIGAIREVEYWLSTIKDPGE
jgi:hypothetical protein